MSSNYFLFGNPTLSADQRTTVDIFGRQQLLYFRGYFDSSQAKGPNAAAVQALVPVNPAQRVMTLVGNNNNLIPVTLSNGTVVNTNVITNQIHSIPRNFYLGPHTWNQDLSLRKAFTIREGYRLFFEGDFFNAFNHPNNLTPNTTTGLIDLSQQSNAARIIQLSAKFEF